MLSIYQASYYGGEDSFWVRNRETLKVEYENLAAAGGCKQTASACCTKPPLFRAVGIILIFLLRDSFNSVHMGRFKASDCKY